MRALRRPTAPGGRRRVLGSVAVALVLVGSLAQASLADDDTPTQQQVDAAKAAAAGKARDVASVQAELALANDELRQSTIRAAQATEAFNGARWRLGQARAAVRAADRQSALADAQLAERRQVISDTLAAGYQSGPGLRSLSTLLGESGVDGLLEDAATFQNAESAMDDQYDAYQAASTLATVASDAAADARADAEDAAVQARAARDRARRAEQDAAARAQQIASRKQDLVAELADLQGISVRLAEQRQSDLEAEAAQAAAEAAQGADQPSGSGGPSEQPSGGSTGGPSGGSTGGQPSDPPSDDPAPTPSPDPTPEPPPTPDPAPPASGASAAVAFARDQLGDRYVWGAAGPDAWDCSGLTMGAWRAGGRSLPHYSVAQYEQSTPISVGQLQPGDLVFWGSSSRPSSIYHVALYVGGGQIIHAPRTGRPVSEESMYYWIAPNFFARP
ncbi:MAG: C40 family peptidase [Nocardioidaceae bacterium]